MRLLVTRAREDGEALAALLGRRGAEVILEPLLSIEFEPAAALDLGDVQALLFTSANGVRAFTAAEPNRTLPVYAVGDATGRAAREAGFVTVESAAGDVDALAGLVTARLDPKDGALLHIAGSQVAGDLAGGLLEAGFDYRRAVRYAAYPAPRLSAGTARALTERTIDGVLFFSPRSATTFVTLAREARLVAACEAVTAFCLSPAVAAAAGPIAWREVRIAEHPDQESLLASVDATLGRTGPGENG